MTEPPTDPAARFRWQAAREFPVNPAAQHWRERAAALGYILEPGPNADNPWMLSNDNRALTFSTLVEVGDHVLDLEREARTVPTTARQ